MHALSLDQFLRAEPHAEPLVEDAPEDHAAREAAAAAAERLVRLLDYCGPSLRVDCACYAFGLPLATRPATLDGIARRWGVGQATVIRYVRAARDRMK